MLWKKAGEKWTNDELLPVKIISYSEEDNALTVLMVNGERKLLKF